MRLETFFEKFEQIADAPNAVAKMRELVLQLAVTGKLVEQIDREGSAAELLEIARGERADLVAARKIKARAITPVEADEQPFAIPARWQWVRLSDVGFELGQKVPDCRFTYIDVGSIDSDKGRISERVETLEPNEAPSRARKLVAQGTVIYSTVRPYLLNIAIIERDFEHEPIASTAFGILHPFSGINNRFLFYWLRSAPFTTYVQEGMKGMTYPAINDEKFYSGHIPVPPSAEQKRIVAKLDELMALCDRLEAQQQERDTRHAALACASLARFSEAPTPANLDFLFHNSYTITPSDLCKSILTLAVQGKLIPFDTSDKKQTVGDYIEFLNGYAFKSEWFKPEGVRLCRNANVGHGILDWRDSAFVDEKIAKELGRFALGEDDVVLSLDRPLITTGLKVARVRKTDLPCLLLQRVAKPVPKHDQLNMAYFFLWLNSPEFVDTIDPGRSNGVPHISTRQVQSLRFILPPIAEQRRIVAKVDQLMALVDRLETQLAEAKTKSAALLEAVVHELLNPSAEVINLASYRAAIGCYTIRKMSQQPYFGRTAAMKMLYLAEAHVGLHLGLQPEREAAGPFDHWIYRFEDEGKQKAWFKAVENSSNGKMKVEYQPGKMLAAQAAQAEIQLARKQRKEFDRLLDLLSGKKTEEVEILATLFAAWNDFLIDGHVPSDDEIVTEVRENWHVKKERFTPTVLRQWMGWLRQNSLVPQGRPPRTVHQSKLSLN